MYSKFDYPHCSHYNCGNSFELMCFHFLCRRFNDYIYSMKNVNSVLVFDEEIDLSLLHIVSGYESLNRDLIVQNVLNIPLEPFKPGVDVNRPSGPGNDYWTAAHIAACWGHHSTLKLLLDNGAEPNIIDRNGHNVWDIARAYDNFLCVAVLQQFLYQIQSHNAPAPSQKLKQKRPDVDLQTCFTKLDLSTTETEYLTCNSISEIEKELSLVSSNSKSTSAVQVCTKQCQTSLENNQLQQSPDQDRTPVRKTPDSTSYNHYTSKQNKKNHQEFRSISRVRTNLLNKIDEFKSSSCEKNKPLNQNLPDTQATIKADNSIVDQTKKPIVCVDLLTDDETDTLTNASDETLMDEQMDSDMQTSDETSSDQEDSYYERSFDSSIRKSIISQDTNKSVELYEDMQFGVTLLNESRKSNLSLPNVRKHPSQIGSISKPLPNSTNLELEYYQLNHTQLRAKLLENGMSPGPITECTKKLYIKKLCLLMQRNATIGSPLLKNSPVSSPTISSEPSYSAELNLLFNKKFDFSKAKVLEQDFQNYFERVHCSKVYFTYLLLDPRVTQSLMDKARGGLHSDAKLFEQFVRAIFYIGKGQGNRPFMHLYEAALLNNPSSIKKSPNPSNKLTRILDIWNSGSGVVSLHCFHSISSQEALTRECFMINTIGLHNLTNIQIGQNRIKDLLWTDHKKNYFGAFLLYKAFNLYLVNGERQIRKADVQR
jgi:ankyrin repeat protein